MSTDLTDKLPTPLAYMVSRYMYRRAPSLPRLIAILEMTLLFIEDLLRAQAQFDQDRRRPAPLGVKAAHIRELARRLRLDGREPIVNILNEDADVIPRMVRVRNQWAHGWSSEGMDERMADEFEHDLFRIFRAVERVHIVIGPIEGQGPVLCELRGMRGSFDPSIVVNGPPVQGVKPGAVFAWRANGPEVPLYPFMRWYMGRFREHRLEFLSVADPPKYLYIDPLGSMEDEVAGEIAPSATGRMPRYLIPDTVKTGCRSPR